MNEKVTQQLREFIHILTTNSKIEPMLFFGKYLDEPIRAYIKDAYNSPNWDEDTDFKMGVIGIKIMSKIKKGTFTEPSDIIKGLEEIIKPNLSPLSKAELMEKAVGQLGDICRELLTKMRIDITDDENIAYESHIISEIVLTVCNVKDYKRAKERGVYYLYDHYIVRVNDDGKNAANLLVNIKQRASRCCKQFIEEYNKIINNSIRK